MAYRGVCVARNIPRQVEEMMVFLGLVGMTIRPGPRAKEALQVANRAGIRDGHDYRGPLPDGRAVGKELGLLEGEGRS